MAIGLRISIDVSKIRKDLLFKGKKGTYLNATVFVSDNPDEYGQHGGITQDNKDKEARKIYIGNVKKFWSNERTQDEDPPPDDGGLPF